MSDNQLIQMANQPGVRLNAAEEQRLEALWRRLQTAKGCRKVRLQRNLNLIPTPRAGCGGRR